MSKMKHFTKIGFPDKYNRIFLWKNIDKCKTLFGVENFFHSKKLAFGSNIKNVKIALIRVSIRNFLVE